MPDQSNIFVRNGRTFQEKTVHALFVDRSFAEQMSDVLDPRYLEMGYLEAIVRKFFEYGREYRTFPSIELMESLLRSDDDVDDVVLTQARECIVRARANPLNGDIHWVQENSLEFCRRQALLEAIRQSLDKIEQADYHQITRIIKDALVKGEPRDAGHEYNDGLDRRSERSVRRPISTGWPVVDRVLNGGWERATLSTIIAPTGAGKSMFLCNVAAAAVAQGLNVLYCTLEMADYKIGLRIDSYFSGVPINDVPDNRERVGAAITENVKGRLIIKEWATKQATVQTIRAHLQRLASVKDFVADVVVLDYADLLRGSRSGGEKWHELSGVYEELRGLAQEFNVVMVTADQTNRGGLNAEHVTLSDIAESYAKATVCDLILTISRRLDDKMNNTGRIFVAKSRLGPDGMIFQILFNPATVRIRVLDHSENPIELMAADPQTFRQQLNERYGKLVVGVDR